MQLNEKDGRMVLDEREERFVELLKKYFEEHGAPTSMNQIDRLCREAGIDHLEYGELVANGFVRIRNGNLCALSGEEKFVKDYWAKVEAKKREIAAVLVAVLNQ